MEEQPNAQQGTPQSEETPSAEQQRFKTLAVRVDEGVHAQLRFIAQLNGTNISEEIRSALEQRITSAQEDRELVARAQAAREEIEREAAARSAAIAGFIGKPTTAAAGTRTAGRSSARKK